jgi:hypothetical protein
VPSQIPLFEPSEDEKTQAYKFKKDKACRQRQKYNCVESAQQRLLDETAFLQPQYHIQPARKQRLLTFPKTNDQTFSSVENTDIEHRW